MNKKHDDITEILKNTKKYSVSEKKDAQIRNELNALKQVKPISLTNVIMGNYKKFAAVVAALAIVAVVGVSGVLQSQTTYASHLENAEQALQELQLLQNEGVDADQERVRELVQEVMEETNAALALAEKEPAGDQLQKALGEVKSVQEKSMNMFQKYEGEGNSSVEEAVKETQQNQERVMKMLGEQSGEMVREQVQEPAQEQKHLENAEKALEKLQVMQKDGEDADPEQVRGLVQEVMQETGSALMLAEQKQEGEQMQKALQEVQQVQEKTMEMLKKYEGEENGSVGEALKETEQSHERVKKMLGEQSGDQTGHFGQ